MYFVYFLLCLETGRNYVGQTDDLLRRYRMHRDGTTVFTRERLVQPVVAYWEMLPSRAAAMRRERYYKAGGGYRRKIKILEEARRLFEA